MLARLKRTLGPLGGRKIPTHATGRASNDDGSPAVRGRKVVLVGADRVGKSSLVRRIVERRFDHRYRPTHGVRIGCITTDFEARRVDCTLWDRDGGDDDSALELRALASAYLLVVDGCRADTFAAALGSMNRIESALGARPFLLLINKADRLSSWKPPRDLRQRLTTKAVKAVEVSALTGQGIDEVLSTLARQLISDEDARSRPASSQSVRTSSAGNAGTVAAFRSMT